MKMGSIPRIFCCLLVIHGTLMNEVHSFMCDPPVADFDDYFHNEPADLFEDYGKKPLKATGCYRPNKTKMFERLQEGTIPITCGKCSVYDVNIVAWRSETSDEEKCGGLTPELLTSSRSCVGQKSCSLQYVPSIIMWTKQHQRHCTAEVPDTVELNYSCLSSDIPVSNLINNKNKVEADHGLVRSHFYIKRSRNNYPTGETILNNHSLQISPPQDSKNESYVLIKVLDIDKDSDDELVLREMTKTCYIKNWVKGETHNITTRSLHFDFQLARTSKAGKGFEICFQWFSDKEQNAAAIFQDTVKSCENTGLKANDPHMYEVIRDISSRHFSGIIQSHPDFPWNYIRPIRERITPHTNSWTSVIHVLKAPKQLTKLSIWIEKLHFGIGDWLEITSQGKKTVSDLEEGNGYFFQGDSVTLNLTILNSGRHTGTGFRMCYEWYSGAIRQASNLCETFVYKVDGCKKKARKQIPKKCRMKRRRKTKKGGKKGKKGGKKKNKKNKRRKKRHNRMRRNKSQ